MGFVWENSVRKFSIFFKDEKENEYTLAEDTDFLAGSNSNSSANIGPLMTNNGVLEM